MIRYLIGQQDKMLGFTKEYVDRMKHKCGTHFSSGPVDVGITAAHNGKQVYICEKCVEKKAAVKAKEDAGQVSRFVKRWVA